MRSSRIELNKYLKTIPGKNVIDIKPMENNCYLVIYKEYEEVYSRDELESHTQDKCQGCVNNKPAIDCYRPCQGPFSA